MVFCHRSVVQLAENARMGCARSLVRVQSLRHFNLSLRKLEMPENARMGIPIFSYLAHTSKSARITICPNTSAF